MARVQGPIEILAADSIGNGRLVAMDRVRLGAQHRIGIEWRHGFPQHAITASMPRTGGYSTMAIQRGYVRPITQVSSPSRRDISPNARGYDALPARTANTQRLKDTA